MMPKPTIWMIRFSLIYLLVSVLTGGLILSHKVIDIHPMLWSLLPLHYELAIWGWLVQFVMGTAYWMFPKRLQVDRRGPVLPAWIMVGLFNTGLILLAASTLISGTIATSLTGRMLIALSIILFAGLNWKRVITYRKR